MRAWTLGLNRLLPESIAVRFAKEVQDDFHARFSALSRRYRYIIHNHSVRPGILNGRVTWHFPTLFENRMQAGAAYLLGEQDFSSFRSAQCESKTPMRNVTDIKIFRQGIYIIVEIEANAFLHHMVRNIVGVLMRIGAGTADPIWAKTVLEARDRQAAGVTAEPDGLYLLQVNYPEKYLIPNDTYSGWFLGV